MTETMPYHNKLGPLTLDNLRDHVVIDEKTGCWLWRARKAITTYGFKRHNGKNISATRLVYRLVHGDQSLPDNLFVLHRCDNPPCVNPDHLFVGTQLDNIRDCISKGRNVCGAKTWNSKLTNEQVREMRQLHSRGFSGRSLSRRYGINDSAVSAIVHGRKWKHVAG